MKHQPVELLMVMSKQMFNFKLLKLGMTNNMGALAIEQQLKITKFAQMVNKPMINSLTIERIDCHINEMTILDYNIKRGIIDPFHGFKFMLSK